MIQGTKIYNVLIKSVEGEAVEQKGFVDNLKVSDYPDFDITKQPDFDETLDLYENKARGYVRFQQICINLQKGLDTLINIKTTGADSITAPNDITFDVIYTQPDGLVEEVTQEEFEKLQAETTEDEPEYFQARDGRYFIKGVRAIKRLIAKVLVDNYDVISNYFNNTGTPSANPMGWQLERLAVKGPCETLEEAESYITITEILE
jgi:hypothetical protein